MELLNNIDFFDAFWSNGGLKFFLVDSKFAQ